MQASLTNALFSTLLVGVAAFVLGVLPGLLAALWMHLSPPDGPRRAYGVLLAAFSSLPALPFVLVALWFLPGSGLLGLCLLSGLCTAPWVAQRALHTLAPVGPSLLEAAVALGAGPRDFGRRIVWPAMRSAWLPLGAKACARAMGEASLGLLLWSAARRSLPAATALALEPTPRAELCVALAIVSLSPLLLAALLTGRARTQVSA